MGQQRCFLRHSAPSKRNTLYLSVGASVVLQKSEFVLVLRYVNRSMPPCHIMKIGEEIFIYLPLSRYTGVTSPDACRFRPTPPRSRAPRS